MITKSNIHQLYSARKTVLTAVTLSFVGLQLSPVVLAAEGGRQLEEVIVNAERREGNYQDLGGTAISFTGEDLKMQGIQNITDLAESIPGLEINNNGGNVEVWIRGVGTSNNTELGDPAAATHFDDIYVPRPAGIGTAFFDIKTVEVNIGPQGTLRGRNATAGSVNIVPWAPGLGVWNFAVEAEIGNYEQESYTFVVNAPLGEKAAARLALYSLEHESYYNDVGPLEIGVAEAADDFGARLQFYFEPTDKMSILLASDYILEQGTGYTGSNYAAVLGAGLSPSAVKDPRDVYARGFEPEQHTQHWGAKFQFKYDFGFAELEYTAGLRDLLYDYAAATPLSPDFEGFVFEVQPGQPLPTNEEGFPRPPLEQALDNFSRFQFITDSVGITHEIRLVSPGDEDIFYSVGLFHFNESQRTFLATTGDRAGFFQGIEFNQPVTDTESSSIYGDMTWSITDRTRLTAGLRYTDDHKDRVGVNAQYGFLLFGFDTSQPEDEAFGCCVGVRVGTPGFEFAGTSRTIFDPDVDKDGEITSDEFIGFYLNGVSKFGVNDTLDEILYAMLNDKSVFANDPKFNDLSALYPTLGQVPCTDYDITDNIVCNEDGFYDESRSRIASLLADGTTSNITPQLGSIDDNFIDWRLRIEHDIADDHLAYLLVATGHKSGGFNDTFPDTSGIDVAPTYDTEEVLMFELGSKNEFDIGNVPTRLNGSAFYYDYTDQVFTAILSVNQAAQLANGQQTVDQIAPSDAALGVSFSFNAADSEIYGIQLDGQFNLPYELTLKWSGLWLEAKIKEGRDIQDFRFQQDIPDARDDAVFRPISGRRLPNTPKFQFNASLSQAINTVIGDFDYIISAGWRDEQFKTIFNSIDFSQPDNPRERLNDRVEAYWTFDAGIGYSYPDSKFRLEAFINNIEDKVRPAAIIITQFDNTRFFTRPRTFGVRAKWQY